ncbi:hypothetical protein DNU06_04980 [Putridiphycobacter roseus]|uniref:Uncharacterized protein n=1 Tax=Putridiphycobacter roseus TaxID=2219161 RepID=A0A2W1NEU2_9FLAO|nr:T9SS type A sorting domain-containing protein [Putridiphycobacter roseus]PZE17975.1 hypothetical protein DNU06_04980 [Putridiphycobacter roseus]
MKKIYNLFVKSFALIGFTFSLTNASAQYCTAGPSSTGDSNVESVTLIGNSSTISYTGCPGFLGLEDLTATHSTDLERGNPYSADIIYGTCGGNYTGYGKVWIDFNQDGDFDDAGEEIGSTAVSSAAIPLSSSYSFTVPLTATIGQTRMRVIQQESGSVGATLPCVTFTWGSAVDFTINIIDCSAGPSYSTISPMSCGYYTAPSGAVFHDAGTYSDTIVNHLGCDSVITINLSTTNTFSTINPVVCGTYVTPSGNNSYGVSGVYSDTIPNAAGCDSVITINLTNNNSVNVFSTSACNVYTSPSGIQHTQSGTFNDTITNAVGCDSIMTITLTMFYNNSVTIFVSSCGGSYTSNAGNVYTATGVYIENFTSVNGCDSILYVDLMVAESVNQSIVVEACDEWTAPDGTLFTANGTHIESFTNVTGCDSVNTYLVSINTVNETVTLVSALTIEANETGASYQWIDCNNGNAAISGETGQTFVASVNGDYACEVTKDNCTKVSKCVRIGSLGVENESTPFSIYPNPSIGVFNIELNEVTENTVLNVTNAAGQVVFTRNINESKTTISLENVKAGIYFIQIKNDNGTTVKSLVIQ